MMSPRELPMFQQLIKRANAHQHGHITERQYRLLESAFLRENEPVSFQLLGWFHQHRHRLRQALAVAGIVVKPDRVPRLHPYRLSGSGIQRLVELESKIKRSGKRRR